MPEKRVDIPEGVEISVENNVLVVKGPKGEVRREFPSTEITMEKKGNSLIVSTKSERRKLLALLGTWRAHTANMITGVTKGWEVNMRIVYSHFPVKFSIKEKKIFIENFLGERNPRTTHTVEGTEIKNDKDSIKITGIDKERVGQAAANIEQASKVVGFDRRVFQDGIYIMEKTHPSRNGLLE